MANTGQSLDRAEVDLQERSRKCGSGARAESPQGVGERWIALGRELEALGKVCSLPADDFEQPHVLGISLVETPGGVDVSVREHEREVAGAHQIADEVIPQGVAFFTTDLHDESGRVAPIEQLLDRVDRDRELAPAPGAVVAEGRGQVTIFGAGDLERGEWQIGRQLVAAAVAMERGRVRAGRSKEGHGRKGNRRALLLVNVWGEAAAGALGIDARSEQVERVEVDPAGDALDALKRQVALSAFYAAHVGAMDAEHVGKRLLAQAACLTVRAQVAAQNAL